MKNKMTILLIAIVVALLTTPALAQQRRMQGAPDERTREEGAFAPEPGRGGPPSEERREEIRKKIETIRIWRLTEELKLDAATGGKLSALLSSIDQKRREIQREQMETMRALRRILGSQKPDDGKIKQLLDKLETNHHSLQNIRNAELKGLKDILNVEQQARFLVFQQEFEREMRDMIGNARGSAGQRQGFGGTPGQRPGFGGIPGQGRGQGGPGRFPE